MTETNLPDVADRGIFLKWANRELEEAFAAMNPLSEKLDQLRKEMLILVVLQTVFAIATLWMKPLALIVWLLFGMVLFWGHRGNKVRGELSKSLIRCRTIIEMAELFGVVKPVPKQEATTDGAA